MNDYSDERRAGEWVPYVQAARDEREQNLEAYLQDGRLRYRYVKSGYWYNENITHITHRSRKVQSE